MKEFTLQVDYKICGIVLAGGSSLISRDLELFEKMLICDMFRGEHSTGVMAGYKLNATSEVFSKVTKAAIPGDVFVRSELWEGIKNHKVVTQSAYNPSTTITTSLFPKFLVGHNRYATQGAVNNQNAHPFTHGHITMCHNGTLIDQDLLPDHKRFVVDSENICYALSVWGTDKTIQNLDGAFTLVWFDSNEQTVNIIRNDERPFHLVETSGGDWFGASEEDMIMWLINRKKYSPSVKRHFECEVGVQYVFDVSSGFKLKKEIKHELPKFTSKWVNYSSTYTSNSYGGYDYSVSTKPAYQKNMSSEEKQNVILKDSGYGSLKIGGKVEFYSSRIEPYGGYASNTGKLCGWIANSEGYMEIQVHSYPVDDFEMNAVYTGIVSYAFLDHASQVPTMTVRGASKKSKGSPVLSLSKPVFNEISESGNKAEQFRELMSGERFSREEWDKRSEEGKTCCVCSNPILYETSVEALVSDGNIFCDRDCFDLLVSEFNDTPPDIFEEDEDVFLNSPPPLPKCATCDTSMSPNNVSVKEKLCKDCHRHYYESKKDGDEESDKMFRKEVNGMLITNAQWNKMNECSVCKTRIPWALAEDTEFLFNSPFCGWCKGKIKGK